MLCHKVRRRYRQLQFEQCEKRVCLSNAAFIEHNLTCCFPASVTAADLDGDGDADVLSASSIFSTAHGIAWHENIDGMGTFARARLITDQARSPVSLAAADVDGDGDLDVLSALSGDDKVVWYQNTDGNGNFGPQQVIAVQKPSANLVTAADMDGDGDLDVVSAGFDGARPVDSRIVWYENTDGKGAFSPERVITTQAKQPSSIVAADVDADGAFDLLVADIRDNKIAWYRNTDGMGNFGPQQLITARVDSPESVMAADMDGDGDLDVLSASSGDGSVAWYENADGKGTFGPPRLITRQQDLAHTVTAADMDGDGDLDVLAASASDNHPIAWYQNTDGKGTFGPQRVIKSRTEERPSIAVADLDRDGDLDVLSGFDGRSTTGIAWYEQRVLGDSNDDGVFDSSDLVRVFQAGEYEDGIAGNSTFDEGDWNGDGEFDSADLVVAFQGGHYERAPIPPRIVDAGPDLTVDEGVTVNLTAHVDDPGVSNGSDFVYHWEVVADNGQVIPEGDERRFRFVPQDDGVYLATVTVTDQDDAGKQYSDSVRITVQNVAPQLVIASTSKDSTEKGVRYRVVGAIVDPGDDDWQISVDDRLGTQVARPGDRLFVAGFEAETSKEPYQIRLTVADDDGGVGVYESVLTVDEITAPRVTEVLVRGSRWPRLVLDDLESKRLGTGGYRIPTGSAAQLDPLVWSTVDTIVLRFSENVIVRPRDLVVTGTNRSFYPVPNMQYDPRTFTAAWTFPRPFETDKLLIALSDNVQDDEGNALDGEWLDGSSQESGNGEAGGGFAFRANVGVGDTDQDGATTPSDIALVRNRLGARAPGRAYSIIADVDADGTISDFDIDLLQNYLGRQLPVDEPHKERTPLVTSSLTGWWSGNGHALDRAGENDGRIDGVALVPGTVGDAFQFDGRDDYISVPDSPDLDLTTALTIQAWVQRDEADRLVVVSKRDPAKNTGYRLVVLKDGRVRATVFGQFDHVSSRRVPVGEFTHVAWTYGKSGESRLYIDGVSNDILAHRGPISTNDEPLQIGREKDEIGRWQYGKGVVDELTIYDRPLSASLIKAISKFMDVTASGGIGGTPSLPGPTSDSFRIATYNTFLLSSVMKCVTPNVLDCLNQEDEAAAEQAVLIAAEIAAHANDYDVIALNEVWDEDAKAKLVEMLSPFFTNHVRKIDDKDFIDVDFEDSGLMLFSKVPIAPLLNQTHQWDDVDGVAAQFATKTTPEVAFIEFDECDGEDCLAAKGAALVRLAIPPGGPLNPLGNIYVVFTHMQADYGGEEPNSETRDAQLADIVQLLVDTLGPQELQTAHIFVTGDLNVRGEGGLLVPGQEAIGGTEEWQTQFGDGFFRNSVTDAWAHITSTSSSDVGEADMVRDKGITHPDEKRLDYILVNNQRVPNKQPTAVVTDVPQYCVQHMTVEDLGPSDHLSVRMDYNREWFYCNPRLAWEDPPVDTLLDFNPPLDAVPDGMDTTRIKFPGSMQWFHFSPENGDNEYQTVSIGVTQEYDQDTSSGVVFELYLPDDLSTPKSQYLGQTLDLTHIQEELIAKTYTVPDDFYIRVYSPNRSWTGDYSLYIHKHTGQSPQDAIILEPHVPQQYDEFKANQQVGMEDTAWFQIDITDMPDSGLSQQVRFLVYQYTEPSGFSVEFVPKDDITQIISSVDDHEEVLLTEFSQEFKGDVTSSRSMYMKVHRKDKSKEDSFTALFETNLLYLHGKHLGLPKSRKTRLICHDETNPESGSDEIRLMLNVDGLGFKKVFERSYDCDEMKDIGEIDLAPIAFVQSIQAKLIEGDTGNPDDETVVHVISASLPPATGVLEVGAKLSVQWDFDGEAEYVFQFNVSRRLNP